MIELVVYGMAQPAGSKKAGVAKNGRPFVRDANPSSREWKRQVQQESGRVMDGRALLRGPLALEVVFVRPRPVGHFDARGLRPSAPVWPTTRPDATKMLRGIEDAMTGVIYRDDAQIVQQTVWKIFGEPARVEIRVDEIREERNGQEPRRDDQGDRRGARARERGADGGAERGLDREPGEGAGAQLGLDEARGG